MFLVVVDLWPLPQHFALFSTKNIESGSSQVTTLQHMCSELLIVRYVLGISVVHLGTDCLLVEYWFGAILMLAMPGDRIQLILMKTHSPQDPPKGPISEVSLEVCLHRNMLGHRPLLRCIESKQGELGRMPRLVPG